MRDLPNFVKNRIYRARISERQFHQVVRLFALDLGANNRIGKLPSASREKSPSPPPRRFGARRETKGARAHE